MSNGITLVCADNRVSEQDRAIRTLEHCSKLFQVEEVLFFTDKDNIRHSDIKIINNIQDLSQTSGKMYDFFVLSQLVNYITTTHYLIVQTDGYIKNPSAWSNEFFEYDYVGAPWKYSPFHDWEPHRPVSSSNSVGNGGFSLRSVKLGNHIRNMFCSLSKKSGFTPSMWNPEDCFICRDLRKPLELLGVKFAPEELAFTFSCENKIYSGQFGFHGKETMRMNNFKYL